MKRESYWLFKAHIKKIGNCYNSNALSYLFFKSRFLEGVQFSIIVVIWK